MDNASNAVGEQELLARQRSELHTLTLRRACRRRLDQADLYAEQPPTAGRAAA